MPWLVFAVVAAGAVLSAMGLVVRPNPLHGALFLVANLFCVAVLYLMLRAEFLALAQVIVYAGAIMVLFLFAIMLLIPGRAEAGPDPLARERRLALPVLGWSVLGPARAPASTAWTWRRMVPPAYYVGLSAILFTIGVAGVLVRRNPLVIFMSIELMLNAANLAFVAFGRTHGTLDGQVVVIFVMTVAAAEVAVGLAIIVAIFRARYRINVDDLSLMRW